MPSILSHWGDSIAGTKNMSIGIFNRRILFRIFIKSSSLFLRTELAQLRLNHKNANPIGTYSFDWVESMNSTP